MDECEEGVIKDKANALAESETEKERESKETGMGKLRKQSFNLH